ncbi:MAG: cobalt-zinc-cadmium resistance protein [SAR86 cluster bacterium]|uniref:Cobalt-zinc-cadmium resistance protein n=1 Tax=SAR86 cluster bacterium TaxID=2030880 RepID=A0A2A4MPL2_9GAMM|nr:MAG: cobalt-zinc-cadmium resistance protein [SAR86 cluster bacterium]
MMMIFLASGTIAYFNLHQEEFPNVDMGMVQVSVPYLGASPQEAEQGVCLRLEEALDSAENIERITSTAREGGCDVMLELTTGAELNRVLNDIKGKVDAITTFPAETEKPIVKAFSATASVITLALAGDADDGVIKDVAEGIKNDLLDLDGISTVSVEYLRPLEIAIEVSEFTLRQYSLTLEQISSAIRRSSLDMPGGTLRTDSGEILIRTKGQVYSGEEYADIIIQSYADGSQLRLGDIATVTDGFDEGYLDARINGQNAATINVMRVGDEDIVSSAKKVREYFDAEVGNIMSGLKLTILNDAAVATQERIGTVAKNAYTGLVLVLIILSFFLRFKLAVWVAAGIPIAIAGALSAFPSVGLAISTLSVMGFILVLGIIVDDAIVVGERIHAHERKGLSQEDAAIEGTMEVSVPVIFGVFTTIAAFLPILLLGGQMGAFFNTIGAVVVFCLIASLLESQLILPGHIAHRKTKGYFLENTYFVLAWQKFQQKIADGMEYFSEHYYKRALDKVLRYRYAAWATATAVIIITAAMLSSGRVIFQFMPAVEGDVVYASLQMPLGVPISITEEAVQLLEDAAIELQAELDEELVSLKVMGMAPQSTESVVRSVLTIVGGSAPRGGPGFGGGGPSSGSSHIAEVVMDLTPFFDRGELSSAAIRDRWRDKVGSIPDALELTFVSDTFSAGDAINFRLEGRNEENLKIAATQLREELARYPGTFDITDSFRAGKQEVQIEILESGKTLGLTLNDIATQVRQAFYGVETQRIQRGTDDIRVMVRYPMGERHSLGNLESLMIRTSQNAEVPFLSVASFSLGNGYSSINRQNGRRVVTVRSDIDRTVVKPEEIRAEVIAKYRDTWERELDVEMVVGGEGEQQLRSMEELFSTFPLAMMIIYALLAIPLKSYFQPLVIMSVIPFGAIGAVFGHFIMGADLVFFSMLGIIALSGVVVNSSLVLVVSINRMREEGVAMKQAVSLAGMMRFRPIILTSVTTFIGLVPLMITASPATFFVIPMAISLAFGVLFATVITLFLVPSLYLMLHDVIGDKLATTEAEAPNDRVLNSAQG